MMIKIKSTIRVIACTAMQKAILVVHKKISEKVAPIIVRAVSPMIRRIMRLLPRPMQRRLYDTYTHVCNTFSFRPIHGYLSIPALMKISTKNLIHRPSRTIITIGAISIGTGAIVFLMSLGYGLQSIVNNRLIQPYSMRLADVQSDSTALALTEQSLRDIKKMPGVADVAGAVSLAGSLSINNSKLDVVVIGASNAFLNYSHILPLHGKLFSQAAEKQFVYTSTQIDELISLIKEEEETRVLGLESQKDIESGTAVAEEKIRFRIKQEVYVPVRTAPMLSGEVLGFAQGDVLQNYDGQEVWGGRYESVDTAGHYAQGSDGTWFGKWIRTTVPLYKETFPTVYEPVTDENGAQVMQEGYIPEIQVHILSQREVVIDKQLEDLLVLGESTAEASLTSSTSAALTSTASASGTVVRSLSSSDSAALNDIVQKEVQDKKASQEAEIGVVSVEKKGGKEIIISTKIIKALQLDEKKIIGKEIMLDYIISGGLIKGVNGRVFSKGITYTVVGIIKDDKQALVFTPIADVLSMGVQKYTLAKVLARDEASLPKVRQNIEAMGFVTRSLVDTLAQVNKLFTVMKFLLGAFGLIALVVAIIGMFNTLTISLLERTREVAVMKTLGTTDFDVLRLFVFESFLIGMCGGLMGIVGGTFVGTLINVFLHVFQKSSNVNLFVTPFGFLLFIFFLSIIVGLVTGLYPARRAKNISALNALRYE